MKQFRNGALCVMLAGMVFFGFAIRPARAIRQFQEQFEAVYVEDESTDPTKQAFAEAVRRANCKVCHLGASRKQRNAYGRALEKLLDRDAARHNVEKIQQALRTVEGQKANPTDPNSPTFGQLISAGKLPGGEPK